MRWSHGMVTWDGHMGISHGIGQMGWSQAMGPMGWSHRMSHMGWSHGMVTWDWSHGMVTWDGSHGMLTCYGHCFLAHLYFLILSLIYLNSLILLSAHFYFSDN